MVGAIRLLRCKVIVPETRQIKRCCCKPLSTKFTWCKPVYGGAGGMCMPIASRAAEEYPGSTRGARLCAPTVSTHVSVRGLHHAAPHHRAPRHLRHLPPLGADRIPRAATSDHPPHWDVM